MKMSYFILLLLATAAAQVLGGAISWFFVKKFSRNLRLIILVELLLMFLVASLLIMEGVRITPFAVASVVAGAMALFIVNETIPHKRRTTAPERIGFLVLVAMCIHEFPEGIAFGSSYLVAPSLGAATAILIALHNIPEGSIISIPYFMRGRFTGGLKAVSITQLLYVTGGLLGYYLLVDISQQLQALAMTFAAGAMLYIIGEEFLWMRGQ